MALNQGNRNRVKLSLEIMGEIETAAGVNLPAPSEEVAQFRMWHAAQLVKIYCALEVGDSMPADDRDS